ncbi:PREDICTED: voltage-dependent anion-selective channel-like [Eufriesea mexicana]|uniref:voltage-dependent anion-selective channel-like n=1 Tax=Eufriesea mexicana TaxID=516756 RepID=UPI00083C4AA8|nr:PREDICTED: voltage-dependent anion-selective channel-like [Eufriesea mexicana]
MAPPSYNDLGKSARDIFSSGYHFGLIKLDVKTKTKSGVEFSSGGVSNQDSGKVFGTLETKYNIEDYGLKFSEKWNTDNTLATDVTFSDKLLKGLTLGYGCTFSPQTGTKTGKLKTSYSHDNVSANADFDLSLSGGPLVNASTVVGYQGWLAGYQACFDTQRNKLTKNNFALGYTDSDFSLHAAVNDGCNFNGLIYHKVKPELEGAINLQWNSSNNVTQFGIATKYNLEHDASIRAKINSNLQIGLGYQQKLRDGVTLTLSTNIDGKNFGSGGHKIGLALDLQA